MRDILSITSAYSLSDRQTLDELSALACSVQDLPGDIVECGVLNGGSAATIAYQLPDRTVWLYDSFQGMPNPSKFDPEDSWGDIGLQKLIGAQDRVCEVFEIAGLDLNNIIFKSGWFEDSFFEGAQPEDIAFLHVDCDWYDSVLLTLLNFYDRVVDGGIIVLDDWSWWEGARKGFYDWCFKKDEYPMLTTFGTCQAYWRKGETRRRPR